MAKREYIGDPIDATMQYIKERKNKGETVAGTTADDLGDEHTDAIPEFVDRSRYDAEELGMVQRKILFPDYSLKKLAEEFDYDYHRLSSFLQDFRGHYRDELKDAGLFEALVPPSRRAGESNASEEIERAAFKEFFQDNPEASIDDAINTVEPTHMSKGQVCGIKGGVASQRQAAENGDGPIPEKVVGEIGRLREAVESLETQVEGGSDDATVAELPRDTLFAIVAGEDLETEDRRAVFDLVVGGDDG